MFDKRGNLLGAGIETYLLEKVSTWMCAKRLLSHGCLSRGLDAAINHVPLVVEAVDVVVGQGFDLV